MMSECDYIMLKASNFPFSKEKGWLILTQGDSGSRQTTVVVNWTFLLDRYLISFTTI